MVKKQLVKLFKENKYEKQLTIKDLTDLLMFKNREDILMVYVGDFVFQIRNRDVMFGALRKGNKYPEWLHTFASGYGNEIHIHGEYVSLIKNIIKDYRCVLEDLYKDSLVTEDDIHKMIMEDR
jgi:hypothetical protein